MEEKRIYVAVAATIQTPLYPNTDRLGIKTTIQPAGRQIAQACHVVNELRIHVGHRTNNYEIFFPTTTIILRARDSKELEHISILLSKKKLYPVNFEDENPEYGDGKYVTAIAVYASPIQVRGILDYLPLWGAK